MSGDDSSSSYAPKSPDLSSFYSSDPTQPASQPPNQGSGQYKLHAPAYSYNSSYSPPGPSALVPVPQQRQFGAESVSSTYTPSLQQQSPPRHSYQPPSTSVSVFAQSKAGLPSAGQDQLSRAQHPTHTRYSGSASSEMPPRRAAAAPQAAPTIEPSPVKTKFPTARIKRIMQADEEVGKVAQQTPIAVGKALELFMIQLVTKSADVARDKGSRKVTASMLKQVVEMDDQWDFLRDIVSRVENEKEGSRSKVKPESDSDEDSEPKKRVRGARRKKG